MESRKIPGNQKKNVEKQFQQLSYCLTQAREFSASAQSSSLSTKALQAYYSITSLANVEILWKSDGNGSIDRRRSVYHRHGLDLTIGESIDEFSAKPQIDDGNQLVGLFGLWRQYARHAPHYGEHKITYTGIGSQHTSLEQLSSATPLSEFPMGSGHISLRRCLGHIPGLQFSLADMNKDAYLVRGRVSLATAANDRNRTSSTTIKTIIQPAKPSLLNAVADRFKFPPAMVSDVKYIESGNAIIFDVTRKSTEKFYQSVGPESFSEKIDNLYFISDGEFLNEFGYFYVGLYILGMITRYHPQRWIRELSRNSDYTVIIDEFIDLSLTRAPLLVLGELRNDVFVYQK
ncbi:MAG: YaaC family protein [Mesorhizobium sp.]|nr:YaaC family protein [Mesorhizobium sp.]